MKARRKAALKATQAEEAAAAAWVRFHRPEGHGRWVQGGGGWRGRNARERDRESDRTCYRGNDGEEEPQSIQ
jgi:hypothetical protein